MGRSGMGTEVGGGLVGVNVGNGVWVLVEDGTAVTVGGAREAPPEGDRQADRKSNSVMMVIARGKRGFSGFSRLYPLSV